METTATTVSLTRWPMSLEHTEKLRKIVLSVNRTVGDSNETYFLAVDYAFRVGKYIESAKDSDRNIWVGCHRKPESRDLIAVFREKHMPGWDQLKLVQWAEWFLFQYIPTYYPDMEQQLAFFTRVLGGQHPLDAIQ